MILSARGEEHAAFPERVSELNERSAAESSHGITRERSYLRARASLRAVICGGREKNEWKRRRRELDI